MLQKTFFSKDESVNESIKDSDVILVRSMWTEKERDVRKALAKDRKVAKHIGKNDIDVYFDDNELVAGGDSGKNFRGCPDAGVDGRLPPAEPCEGTHFARDLFQITGAWHATQDFG